MIVWRLFIGKERLSSRYFSVAVIPWTIACINGIGGITKILGYYFKKRDYRSICHVNSRTTFQKRLCVLILIPIVAGEIISTFKVDYYRANIIMAYDHFSEEINKKQYIYISDPKIIHENNRIMYYAGHGRNNSIRFIDNKMIPYICEAYPDFPYGNKNIFFINEDNLLLDQQYLCELKSHLSNFGSLKQCSRVFTSHAHKKTSSVYQFMANNQFLNLDPASKAGSKIRTYSPDSVSIVKASSSIENGNIIVSGENTELYAKDYIGISTSNRIDMNVLVKNIGSCATMIYVGYILFDINKNVLGSDFFPFKYYDGTIDVVDTKPDDGIIIASSDCSWIKHCAITLYAKDDLSDVPNPHILKGKVSDVSKNDRDTNKIIIKLDSSLQNPIPANTPIRFSCPHFSYLHMNSITLLPGESRMLSSSIAKYDTFHQFSTNAIPSGVYFVKPMFFSYSLSNKEINTVSLSQWCIRY